MGHVIDFRSGSDRFRTEAEGRTTWHAFSFGAHYDPRNTGFGSLVALNEELLPPGTGYAAHPHADLDIVSWVIEGELQHLSAVGEGVVGPGQVQRLRAGSGVEHGETCHGTTPVRFLQAWVRPDESSLEPDYVTAAVPLGMGWACAAGAGGPVDLASAGTSLQVAELPNGSRLPLPDVERLLVHVTRGRILLGERTLGPGDAARLVDEAGREVRAETDAQLVAWSFARPTG